MLLSSASLSSIKSCRSKITLSLQLKPSLCLLLFVVISANLTLTGCTGSHSASESSNLNSDAGAQRLPADISQIQSGEAAGFRSSDDPNLALPEPSSRGKAGVQTEAAPLTTKLRKPASTR